MEWVDDNSTNDLWDIGRKYFNNESSYFPQICPLCGV